MKKHFMLILLSLLLFSQCWAKEFAKFYIGSELKFEPGEGKNAGFGEFHWGLKSEVFFGTLVAGFSSKSFLSSIQLKSPDVAKILDNLVQSNTEVYFGTAIDKIFYRQISASFKQTPEEPQKYFESSSLIGGPDVLPGWGVGARFEGISNVVNKKAEKDPSFYFVASTYVNAYYATSIMIIRPMVGIGINEGLDYHFVVERMGKIEREFASRLKLRIDLLSKRILKIAGTEAQIFLSFQREWPFKKNGTIQLEDGTLAPATKLVDSSLKLGVSFDL